MTGMLSRLTLAAALGLTATACNPETISSDDDGLLGGTLGPGGDSTTTTGTPPDPTNASMDDCNDSAVADTGTVDGGSTDDGPIGQICGDGFITGTESCDCGGAPCTPAGLGGEMCVGLINPSIPDRIYTGGLLDCNPASCQFRFDTCTFCGDDNVNGVEQCEIGEPTGVSCMDLGMGDGVDDLPCAMDCTFDTTECGMASPKDPSALVKQLEVKNALLTKQVEQLELACGLHMP